MKFGMNSKGWTAIDGGDGASLCAVSVKTAVRTNERPQVIAVAEMDGSAAQLDAATLRNLMSRVDRSLPVLTTLARTQYQLRVMPEPAVPQREMLASLRWSLSTEGDSPLEDFNLDWMRIPTEELLPTRPKQLYAVMTPTASLNSRLAALRAAGVRPKVVDIRETALRNIAGALERAGEGVALVSADAGGVGMTFTYQGSLYLDRYMEQPLSELHAADPTARAQLYERVGVQLLRSIDVIVRSYPFMSVNRVVVAPTPEAVGLFEFLTAQLPLTVESLDLNEVFDLTQVPELAQSSALQARCLVALGAALRSARASA